METVVKELEHARQRPVIRRWAVAPESEEEDGEIASVWAPVPTRGAPVVSKEEHGP